ncbi:ABC transporter ATP-binding protein [Neotabrizicola sp. VNH66]|uniref:ABC transporter ATP-binding protein n=1 Tax=Neotabrizicola sp. VNH66 TaxID=3400918 RepID=UPI003C07D189
MTAAVEIRDLSISFGAAKILPSVTLDVRPGECFGLVGESGSGKSTVLRCISMLNDFWTGRVTIGGRDVRKVPVKERCRMLQMVFQDPYGSLHPRQSVRTVLSEPLRIHGLDRREERMRQAMVDVGLPVDFLERFPHQLSGGQRQRVAIARALILEQGFRAIAAGRPAMVIAAGGAPADPVARDARQPCQLPLQHHRPLEFRRMAQPGGGIRPPGQAVTEGEDLLHQRLTRPGCSR